MCVFPGVNKANKERHEDQYLHRRIRKKRKKKEEAEEESGGKKALAGRVLRAQPQYTVIEMMKQHSAVDVPFFSRLVNLTVAADVVFHFLNPQWHL